MIRTAGTLRSEGAREVAVLDLAAIGQNLTPEQWYDGLLLRLGRQLDLEDEFDDFWLDNARLSPVQRFFEAIYQIVLSGSERRLVIFVDELDTVKSLPFSSDEFFAAIRQCFNARSEDDTWSRLAFCLLGVATPSDLIKDPHISPFNIGRRIVLEDFKKPEVAKLVAGLEAEQRGELLLERIFGWTNGHPYLTQRLCRSVAEQNRSEEVESVLQPGTIDGICHRLFLSNRAKERDDNLILVRERLLRSDHDRSALLDLYRKVRVGQPVVDDETDPLVGALHLSGVTRVDKGKLKVRNRIYQHVFNPSWVNATMPDAEKRRQKEAYRRGVMRTTVLSTVIVLAMLYLAITAYVQSKRAGERLIAQNTENGTRLLADGESFDALTWFAENLELARAGSLSDQLGRQRFSTVLRHSPKLVGVLPHPESVRHFVFSEDGNWLVTAGDDRLLRVWDLEQEELRYPAIEHGSTITFVGFSPDGNRLVTASADQSARLFDFQTGQAIGSRMEHDYEVIQAVFSRDGNYIATASLDDSARIWDGHTGEPVTESLKHRYAVRHIAFSPSSEELVTASDDGTARVWPVEEAGGEARLVLSHSDAVSMAQFSLDGNYVATTTIDGWLRLWERSSGEMTLELKHPAGIRALDISPDGTKLATGCDDGLVRLLDLNQQQFLSAPMPHRDRLQQVRFGPGGDLLLSVTVGNEARVWNVGSGEPASPPFRHRDHVLHADFDSSGRRVGTAGADGLIKIWDLGGVESRLSEWEAEAPAETAAYSPDGTLFAYGLDDGSIEVFRSDSAESLFEKPLQHEDEVTNLIFSPDSKFLVSTGFAGQVRCWDLATGEVRHTFQHRDAVRFVLFNPSGNRLVTTSRDRTAVIWDLDSGEPTIPPAEHSFAVVNASYLAGGREFATASSDNTVFVWSALTGELVRGPFKTGYSLGRPAFDSRGGHFVALDSDSSARVYSLADGRPLSKSMVHRGKITYLDFDSRGTRVVTASVDHTARVWDAWNGSPLSPPLKHAGEVLYCVFGHEDHRLLTFGADRTARLWSVKDGSLLAPVMQHNSPITQAELSFQGNQLLTLSENRIVQWRLEADQRAVEILIAEAALLSGRRRDITGELMGMDPEELVASWSRLRESRAELFRVPSEARYRWHAYAVRQAINREDYFAASFQWEQLSAYGNAGEQEIEDLYTMLAALAPSTDEDSRMSASELEDTYRENLKKRLPERPEDKPENQLDLTDFYNGLLSDAWQFTGTAGNDLKPLLEADDMFGGVEFDIRGVIQLGSSRLENNSLRRFPGDVRGIPVKQVCRRVHVLHACAYPEALGAEIGSYSFQFSEGRRLEMPLRYGSELADWWVQDESSSGDVRSVWNVRTGPGRRIGIFLSTFELPVGMGELTTMGLHSSMTDAAPFVIAITVD